MNPHLDRLQPYPFQKLRELFQGIIPPPGPGIDLSIGEPRHPAPELIRTTMLEHLDRLSNYPATIGLVELRTEIAAWLGRRHAIPVPDAASQVLPVNGSREALFAFAQAVIDPTTTPAPIVLSPNPFYQIYEGAALLAGAEPWYLPTRAENGYRIDVHDIPQDVLQRTQLAYLCSPGNPTGHVMTLDEWREWFDLSDRHGFIIASDECYSEIHPEQSPPLGALAAAQQLGRSDYPRLVVFNSLSKRSNVPGLRSGFAAGNAAILKQFLLYRTYHGSAMSPVTQMVSARAWQDEAHVTENRRLYAEKFAAVAPLLRPLLPAGLPDAAFYLWLPTGVDDTVFTRELYRQYGVTVLPGSYLARDFNGCNPGAGWVRVALVAPLQACVEAAHHIAALYRQLNPHTEESA